MYALGYMISCNETEESLSLVIQFLKDKGNLPINFADLVWLSDRALSFSAALRVHAPAAMHMICPLHLERNLNTHKFNSPGHKALYWAALNAVSELWIK